MVFKKTTTQPHVHTPVNADIFLFNTLSGKKETFIPLEEGKIKMYNCGPTVYSEQHIGNMRAAVFADVLRRVFQYNGYTVSQVINITDVGHLTDDADEGEDKMEQKAKEKGASATDIAQTITKQYLHDLQTLGVNIDAIQFPRATDYIQEQIELTKTLLEKGYAYIIDRGVAFDTSKFKNYGKLGNIHIDKLKEGARIEADSQKHNPTDFWLWKFSNPNEQRQQEWDSPWGIGFPGWHLECTAMSRALLGTQLDIHTGGIEHIPVHHNNEIAQSEALSGKKFVNYWLHNAHLMLDGKKISKSIGNVIYVRTLIEKGYDPLALRYLFLSAKYSAEQNFTWQSLDAAQTALNKIRTIYTQTVQTSTGGALSHQYASAFLTAINDDINTPRALAVLWDLLKDTHLTPEDIKVTLELFDTVLGLRITKTTQSNITSNDDIPQEVLQLLEQRKQARAEKNWAKSDALREKISQYGYTVTDNGTEQTLSTA